MPDATPKHTFNDMIIGFDAKRALYNNTGLGSYSRTLLNDLSGIMTPDITMNLYTPGLGDDNLRAQVRESHNIRLCYPKTFAGRLFGPVWRMRGILDDLKADNVKLYHGLSGELPMGISSTGIKSVVTVHDIIFMRHPEWYNPIDRMIYTWKFHKTCAEADRIIAISECTKRDITLFGGVSPEKISVIYQSCGTRFKQRESEDTLAGVRSRFNLPQRYIINVGTIEERKNVLLAVKALRMLPDDLSLVIVGKATAYADTVAEYVKANSLENRVMMLHDVGYADLPAIYQMAEVSVYPSRYEGFGVPVIEAIQSGLPVVACTGSCLEEAGGNGALYVDPDDVYGMADAIKRVLKGADERGVRMAECLRYTARFENNDVAQRVLELYNDTLGPY